MNESKPNRGDFGSSGQWSWDVMVVLIPGILWTIRLWISDGAPIALTFLAIISAVALCIVIARRWGRRAQIAILVVFAVASMAWLIAIVA